MGITLIVPPELEPVTLYEVKNWCRVDLADPYFDPLLEANRIAAREYLEESTGRQIITATWKATGRCFVAEGTRLPKPPLQSVVSVQYRDVDGTLQTLDAAEYTVDVDNNCIQPVNAWPRVGDYTDAVQITFQAGYGDAASDVPQRVKHAVLMLALHWFDNPQPAVDERGYSVPRTTAALIRQLKDWQRL